MKRLKKEQDIKKDIELLNRIKDEFDKVREEILILKEFLSRDKKRREVIMNDLKMIVNNMRDNKFNDYEILESFKYLHLKLRILARYYNEKSLFNNNR